jgi:hypothetical protein
MGTQHYLAAIVGGMIAGFMVGKMLFPKLGPGSQDGHSGDAAWGVAVLPALLGGGAALTWLDPAALPMTQTAPIEFMAAAGLLVGVGAQMKSKRTDPSQIPSERGHLRPPLNQVV